MTASRDEYAPPGLILHSSISNRNGHSLCVTSHTPPTGGKVVYLLAPGGERVNIFVQKSSSSGGQCSRKSRDSNNTSPPIMRRLPISEGCPESFCL